MHLNELWLNMSLYVKIFKKLFYSKSFLTEYCLCFSSACCFYSWNSRETLSLLALLSSMESLRVIENRSRPLRETMMVYKVGSASPLRFCVSTVRHASSGSLFTLLLLLFALAHIISGYVASERYLSTQTSMSASSYEISSCGQIDCSKTLAIRTACSFRRILYLYFLLSSSLSLTVSPSVSSSLLELIFFPQCLADCFCSSFTQPSASCCRLDSRSIAPC